MSGGFGDRALGRFLTFYFGRGCEEKQAKGNYHVVPTCRGAAVFLTGLARPRIFSQQLSLPAYWPSHLIQVLPTLKAHPAVNPSDKRTSSNNEKKPSGAAVRSIRKYAFSLTAIQLNCSFDCSSFATSKLSKQYCMCACTCNGSRFRPIHREEGERG